MLYLDETHRIYAVADGLGGLPRGALASSLAVKKLKESLNNVKNGNLNLELLFNYINQSVYNEGQKVNAEIGIGTTLTAVHIANNKMTIGHVGDCTVYIYREDTWKKITTDHTMEEEIRSRMAPDDNTIIPEYFSHTLTRCLGQQSDLETDIYEQDIRAGDRILICSDGINKTLTDDEMQEEASKAADPESFIRHLIDMANDHGGPDNSTGIAIFLS